MKKVYRVLIYIILFSTIPIGVFFLLPTWVKYHVVENYIFSRNENGNMLAIMLPGSGAYQRIENVQIEWDGEIIYQQYESVDIVTFGRGSNSGDLSEVKVSYDVFLLQDKVSWDAAIEERYLLPQKNIESDAPELINVAEKICTDKKNDTAYPIYVFTAGYLSWPEGTRLGEDPSALTAYKSRVGVCGEFANLMTALNRACDIPIKSISGLSMPMFYPPMVTIETTWNHPGGAHAWTEVYTGDRWTIADPSWASGMPFDRIWFGRSSGQYLSYGEVGEHEKIYNEMVEWGEKQGVIIGGMSAPLKFVAISNDKDVTIAPTVSVKKIEDNRWVLAVVSYVLLAIVSNSIERYDRRTQKAG